MIAIAKFLEENKRSPIQARKYISRSDRRRQAMRSFAQIVGQQGELT
ncbi:MAG: hypothetical protein HWQ38_11540 [Nostoc sp. NMS7]|nr:hypothetical protein [Nostoc sp. NMS7]MBN3947073.1 hypothetical protein [Nostoc sp. NMS7]